MHTRKKPVRIYKPGPQDAPVDPERCCAAVAYSGKIRARQCWFRPAGVVFDVDGVARHWCGVHRQEIGHPCPDTAPE